MVWNRANPARISLRTALLVALFAVASLQAATASTSFNVLGNPYQPRVEPVLKGNVLYAWVGDLSNPLNFKLSFEGSSPNSITVKDGDSVVAKLQPGSSQVQTPAGSRDLQYPPYVTPEGQTMVPIRELADAIGAATWLSNDHNTLYFSSRLLSSQIVPEAKRLVLNLKCSLPVNYEVSALGNPFRLVVDLKGIVVSMFPEHYLVGNWGIDGIRSGQVKQEPSVTRVVLDLSQPISYRKLSDNPSRDISVQLGEAGKAPTPALPSAGLARIREVKTDSSEKDLVEASIASPGDVSNFHSFVLKDPARLVVDVPDAWLDIPDQSTSPPTSGGSGSLEVAGTQLTRIRYSQFSVAPFIVRFVFDLDALYPFTTAVEEGGKQLKIRFSLKLPKGKIVIDAGHGGQDPGAIGNQGTREKDINLDVATRLSGLLEAAGNTPYLTRSEDVYVPLDQRAQLANDLGADIFVSLHCNAWASPNGRSGLETYYYNPRSKELAESVHRQLISRLGRKDNGVRTARFLVIRKTNMPSILVEMLYINHDEEESLLLDPTYRQRIAEALFAGIRDYLIAAQK